MSDKKEALAGLILVKALAEGALKSQAVAKACLAACIADQVGNVRGDISKLGAEFKKALDCEDASGGLELCIAHAATISTCTMDLQFMEVQWKKNCVLIFGVYFNAAKAEENIKNVRVEAEKMMEIPEEDDEEDDAPGN